MILFYQNHFAEILVQNCLGKIPAAKLFAIPLGTWYCIIVFEHEIDFKIIKYLYNV